MNNTRSSLKRHALLVTVALKVGVEFASIVVPLTSSDSPMLIGIFRLGHWQIPVCITTTKCKSDFRESTNEQFKNQKNNTI